MHYRDFVITNIAAYRFATLENLKALRERLLTLCRDWDLKGSILLSTEGINLFVAGGEREIALLLAELEKVGGLAGLTPKISVSDEQPFSRMLVRIKREIIAFGVPGINPAKRTSPKLPARELKRWLDEGRPIHLLDTRNDYEVKLGTFRGAKVLKTNHFREFPSAVETLPEDWKQTPVVMFCTGGIRCEKAGPYLERAGFEQVFQLDGGILKYFEEVGGEHFDGECFVFDQRVGVDPALRETDSAICFVCQTPLTAEDQADARFVASVSCPYCYRTPGEKMAARIAQRESALRACSSPLPGSQPYQSERPLNIPAKFDGATLLAAVTGIFPQIASGAWEEILRQGRLLDLAGRAADAQRIVHAGERYRRITPEMVEPAVDARIRILHEDEAIVVLEKPAPLPMHPSGRYNRNTLQHLLRLAYAPQKIQAAHRLDANTTGLVVCARTQYFARKLQPQFARGEVEKTYLARVHGWPQNDQFFCNAPISAEAGADGSRNIDEEGQPARSDFRVVRRFPDRKTLLEIQPRTGRTNQIRVHLWFLDLPVYGDPMYLAGGRKGEVQTLSVSDHEMQLHCQQLTFRHPLTQEHVTFQGTVPAWAELRERSSQSPDEISGYAAASPANQ